MDAQVRSEIVGLAHAYCFEKTERDDKIISFLYENAYMMMSRVFLESRNEWA
jgi:hypothetical protein